MSRLFIFFIKIVLITSTIFFKTSLSIAQNNSPNNLKWVKISGEVQNPKAEKITLTVFNDFINPPTIKETYADGFLHFNFDVQISESTSAIINFLGDEIELFLEPDDNINLNFDGNDPSGTATFSGKGAEHNRFLKSYNYTFKYLSTNTLRYDMTQKKPAQFKTFLDEIRLRRWSFFQNYDPKSKAQFSSDFLYFMYSNIDYWWAKNLLKYRADHATALGSAVPISLPDAYFDFLKTLNFNEKNYLKNKNFVEYLDLFVAWFKQDRLQVDRLLEQITPIAVATDSIPIYDEPTPSKVRIGSLYNSIPVTFLEKYCNISASDSAQLNFQKTTDCYYKIQTADNWTAWGKATDFVFNLNQVKRPAQQKEKLIVENQRVAMKIICWMDNLALRNKPEDETITATFLKNEVLDYLNQKTENRIMYTIDGTHYMDIFYKVRTKNGLEGWIFGGGVNIFEKTDTIRTETEQIMPEKISKLNDFDRVFSENILNFVTATDIIRRSYVESPITLKVIVDEFFATNQVKKYDLAVLKAYNTACENWKNTLDNQANIKLQTGKSNTSVVQNSNKNVAPPVTNIFDKYSNKQTVTNSKPSAKIFTLLNKSFPELEWAIVTENLKKTKISIEISSDTRLGLQLILFKDPTLYSETVCKLVPNTNNGIESSFDINCPTIGEIRYGDKKIELFIEPGDEINLKFDGRDIFSSIRAEGKGSINNNYIFDFKRKFDVTDVEMKEKIKTYNFQNYKTYMRNLLRIKQKYLQEYPANKQFSNNFKYYSAADIIYWFGFYLLNYPYEYPLFHEMESPMQLPESYYDFLNEINISAANVLPNQYYSFFLQQYLDYSNQISKQKVENESTFASSILTGEAQAFMNAKALTFEFKRDGCDMVAPKMIKFLETCTYPKYKNWMLELYQSSKRSLDGEQAPSFLVRDNLGKLYTNTDFAGKVVCIDFWATWCEPCLISMKSTQHLANKLKLNNVTFLYFSVDDKKETWEKYLKNHPLDGLQLFPDSVKQLCFSFHINSLPHYVVLDKEGKIVKVYNGNPDESELEKFILGLEN